MFGLKEERREWGGGRAGEVLRRHLMPAVRPAGKLVQVTSQHIAPLFPHVLPCPRTCRLEATEGKPKQMHITTRTINRSHTVHNPHVPHSVTGEPVKIALLGGSLSMRGWNRADEAYISQVHKWLEVTLQEGCRCEPVWGKRWWGAGKGLKAC